MFQTQGFLCALQEAEAEVVVEEHQEASREAEVHQEASKEVVERFVDVEQHNAEEASKEVVEHHNAVEEKKEVAEQHSVEPFVTEVAVESNRPYRKCWREKFSRKQYWHVSIV
jgi:hypothetical protein